MTRALYTTLLFVMTAIGFGEFRGSLTDQIDTAKNKTIEANGVTKQAVEVAWDWPPPPQPVVRNAVLGVRG